MGQLKEFLKAIVDTDLKFLVMTNHYYIRGRNLNYLIQVVETWTGHGASLGTVFQCPVGNQCNGSVWCGMFPHFKAALVPVCTSQRERKLWKGFHTPVFLSFLSSLSLLSSFALLSSSLPFHQPITTNHDLHPHLIQTLYLRVGHSTPLRKTLTVNHYLRIEYFQHPPCVHPSDTKTFALVGGRKSITALVQWAEPENLCPKRPWGKIMGRVETFGPTPSFTLNLVKNGRFQTGNS